MGFNCYECLLWYMILRSVKLTLNYCAVVLNSWILYLLKTTRLQRYLFALSSLYSKTAKPLLLLSFTLNQTTQSTSKYLNFGSPVMSEFPTTLLALTILSKPKIVKLLGPLRAFRYFTNIRTDIQQKSKMARLACLRGKVKQSRIIIYKRYVHVLPA